MTPGEIRQARRIVRNARAMEIDLFELIEEMQQLQLAGAAVYDWQSAVDKLINIRSRIPLLFDLVENIQREIDIPY